MTRRFAWVGLWVSGLLNLVLLGTCLAQSIFNIFHTLPTETYQFYSPYFWVGAFILGVINLRYFNAAHSKGPALSGLTRRVECFSVRQQRLFVIFTLLVLIAEAQGMLVPAYHSVSDIVRAFILNPRTLILYWVVGSVNALMGWALLEFDHAQNLAGWCLLVWIATSAHMFWWIPPEPRPGMFRSSVILVGVICMTLIIGAVILADIAQQENRRRT